MQHMEKNRMHPSVVRVKCPSVSFRLLRISFRTRAREKELSKFEIQISRKIKNVQKSANLQIAKQRVCLFFSHGRSAAGWRCSGQQRRTSKRI